MRKYTKRFENQFRNFGVTDREELWFTKKPLRKKGLNKKIKLAAIDGVKALFSERPTWPKLIELNFGYAYFGYPKYRTSFSFPENWKGKIIFVNIYFEGDRYLETFELHPKGE